MLIVLESTTYPGTTREVMLPALEPNTLFFHHPPSLPGDDLAADMQEAVEQTLDQAGYGHYETAAFAKPGRESRHNMNYWLFGDYLGIGAGAHSKISFADRIVRQMRYRQPREYLARADGTTLESGPPIMEQHELGREDRAFEFMMNALRLTGGFATDMFVERTGLSLTTVQRQLEEVEQRMLITRDHQHIAPTRMGRRFLNDLLQIFLPNAG